MSGESREEFERDRLGETLGRRLRELHARRALRTGETAHVRTAVHFNAAGGLEVVHVLDFLEPAGYGWGV